MDWKQSCRARLPEHLDDDGDLAPPWERFPAYERHTIGWRMGAGEDWRCLFSVFVDDLDPAFEVRLAYLRRHPPAPVSFASWVHAILHPSAEDDEAEGDEGDDDMEERTAAERRAALRQMGLIASDVAYSTWLRQEKAVRWPWSYAETPEKAARYWTRDLWFWSRRVAALRAGPAWTAPEVPRAWGACASPLSTGEVGTLELRRGLRSLAQMLSAGEVVPPWRLGLTLGDFADSFEIDMGYVDAFRLWGMSAFDDREHLSRYLGTTGMPESWEGWIAEHLPFD
jgi:hypothetical protein